MPEIGCSACGDCCENVHIATTSIMDDLAGGPDPREEWEHYEAMGYTNREQVTKNWLSVQFVGEHWRITEETEGKLYYTCEFLDRETRLCTAHDARPDICRGFPFYNDEWGNLDRLRGTPERCSYRKAAVRVTLRGVAPERLQALRTHLVAEVAPQPSSEAV